MFICDIINISKFFERWKHIMEIISTTRGRVIINEGCPADLRECAIQAFTSPTKFTFKSMVKCDQYDDEVRRDCQLALDGELIASPEELAIAQEILDKNLSCEEAQALLFN